MRSTHANQAFRSYRASPLAALLLAFASPAMAAEDEALEAYRRAVSLNPKLIPTIQSEPIRTRLRADFLREARKARGEGRLGEAERFYLLAGNFSESFDLYAELGSVYVDMQAWSKAVVVFKKATVMNPAHPATMAKLAAAYHEAGQGDLAAQFYARALGLDADLARTLRIPPQIADRVRSDLIDKGKGLAERSQPLDAAAKFDLALGLGEDPSLRLEQGRLYRMAGDDHAAARAFAHAIAEDAALAKKLPDGMAELTAKALYDQGVEAFKAQDLVRSNALFDRSLELDKSAKTLYNLGNVHVHAGKLDQAIAFYRQSVELDPKLDEARLNMGMVQIEKGLYAAAIRDLKGLIAEHPQRSEGYDLIAQAYVRMNQPAKAFKVYQAAVNFDTALATKLAHADVKRAAGLAFHDEARTAFEGKDFGGAIDKAQKALALAPDAKVYYLLGNALFASDDATGAIAAYKKALELQPGHAATINNMGNAYLKLKDHVKAAEQFRKATEAQADFAQAWNNLGIALRKAGRTQEAVKAYKKALEIDPDYAAAYFNLGNALQGTGGTSKAMPSPARTAAFGPKGAAGQDVLESPPGG